MGVPGWNWLTSRAVVPLWLTVRMASAPMSMAVVQAAWAVAAAMLRCFSAEAARIRLP